MNKTVEADNGALYGPHCYRIAPEILAELKKLKPHKPVLAAIEAWFWLFVLTKGFLYYLPQLVYLYPILIFFIAGRAGVFLQLAHEAAHGLIGKGKFNQWFGNWVACYPIGLDLKGYAEPHARHHACTNRECDPVSDSEKYKVCDIRNPKLWFLFLKDILGITAITIRFLYDQPDANKAKNTQEYFGMDEEIYDAYRLVGGSFWSQISKYACIGLVQLAILGLLFNFNIVYYFLLWAVPLLTAHMALQRIRGIAEHGLGVQMGIANLNDKNRGTLYTRSFGTSLNHYGVSVLNYIERWLIGSLNVYYHHEHHLFPKVPYYHLPKLHELIGQQEKKNNPYIFEKGYFSCLFFNLRREARLKESPSPA